MKTLLMLTFSLVLSLTIASKVNALQNTLPIDGINSVLQMKIDQKVVSVSRDDIFFPQKELFTLPKLEETYPGNGVETYSVPDCLCHIYSRVF